MFNPFRKFTPPFAMPPLIPPGISDRNVPTFAAIPDSFFPAPVCAKMLPIAESDVLPFVIAVLAAMLEITLLNFEPGAMFRLFRKPTPCFAMVPGRFVIVVPIWVFPTSLAATAIRFRAGKLCRMVCPRSDAPITSRTNSILDFPKSFPSVLVRPVKFFRVAHRPTPAPFALVAIFFRNEFCGCGPMDGDWMPAICAP